VREEAFFVRLRDVPPLAERPRQLGIVDDQSDVMAGAQGAPQRQVGADAGLDPRRVQEQRDRPPAVAGKRKIEEGAGDRLAAFVDQANVRHRQRVRQRVRQVKLDAQQVLRHAVAGRRHRSGDREADRGGRCQYGGAAGPASGRVHGAERAASSG
jgi:hypothetical protein